MSFFNRPITRKGVLLFTNPVEGTMKRSATGVVKASKKHKAKKAYNDSRKSNLILATKGAEIKALDNSITDIIAGTGSAPTFNLLNCPVLGSDFINRVGRKITMKSIRVRGFLVPPAVSTAQAFLRGVLVYDAQPNAAVPLLSDLMQDARAGFPTDVYSFTNLNNRERFTILRDQMWITTLSTGASQYGTGIVEENKYAIDWYVKLKGLTTMFNGTNGGTIADVTSGALFLLFYQSNIVANVAVDFVGSTRLRFLDS